MNGENTEFALRISIFMRQNRSSKAKTPEVLTHMDTLLILWYSICIIITIPVGYAKVKKQPWQLERELE